MKKIGVAFFLLFFATSAYSSCLDDVAKFAEQICGEISKKGSSSVLNANGGLNAKAKGLLNKFLGGVGIEGSIEAAKQTYENVLREDLGNELENNRSCRIKMVEVGQKHCTGEQTNLELEHIKWPEGKKRYYVEAAHIRPSCIEDTKKTNHELKIIIENGDIELWLDGTPLKARLIDEGKTILLSGRIPSEGGYTSFTNGELKVRNDKMLEAELEWIWRDSNGDVCTGAMLISNSLVQEWK